MKIYNYIADKVDKIYVFSDEILLFPISIILFVVGLVLSVLIYDYNSLIKVCVVCFTPATLSLILVTLKYIFDKK